MSIGIIDQLVETFNNKNICYCHWKSNFSLAESMSGDLDLDLLVDRKELSASQDILLKLGFKLALTKIGQDVPGIYHYYGFDQEYGQLVHIHLFSSVLTGESYVKTHLLPFDRMLLENVYKIGQIKVTSKPAELVVFIVRHFIKYGSPLDLIHLARNSASVNSELNWLQEDGDVTQSLTLLKKYCPVIDEQLFLQCVSALRENQSLLKRITLAQRIRRRLQIYKKYSALGYLAAYFQLAGEQILRRTRGIKRNKLLNTGGAVIAFVGPEATGKSTLVGESRDWLGKVFVTRKIHAGKPPSSWVTFPINIVLPWARSLWPRMRTSRLEGHVSADDDELALNKTGGFSGLIYALRSVSLAWDRKQLLVKARKSAANGEIVICDRYPSETIGAMDSPRLEEISTGNAKISKIYNYLARLEKKIYRQIPPPDAVLQLRVSVETAKKRNQERIKAGKESDAYLESRHRQSREWNMAGTKYVVPIDTELPLIETILNVKQNIWEIL